MFIKTIKSKDKLYHYLTCSFRDDRGESQHKQLVNLDTLDEQEINDTIAELSAYRDERFGIRHSEQSEDISSMPLTEEGNPPPIHSLENKHPSSSSMPVVASVAKQSLFQCIWNFFRKIFGRH